jgi:hypothetical protein
LQGIEALIAATEACTKSIEKSRGKLVVKEAARAVSERDDRLLAEKMEALENANKEVGADQWGVLERGAAVYWRQGVRGGKGRGEDTLWG